MATDSRTIEFLAEQLESSGDITTRKMFGEYAIYLDTKVIAFVCDDQLFIKPTEPGRSYLGTPDEAPAYPGSKLYFRIPEDRWEETEWLCQLARVTADALPLPRPKPKSKK